MTSPETIEMQAVMACIEAYFQALRSSDTDQLEIAFHPGARIVGPDEGDLRVMDLNAFSTLVERQKPHPELRERIHSIMIHGHIASACVTDHYLGRQFVDHLALVKVGDCWKIYNKLWHVESP